MKNKFLFMVLVLSIILSSCGENILNDNSTKNTSNDMLGLIMQSKEIPDDLHYSFFVYKSKQSLLIDANDSLYSIIGTEYSNYYNAYLFDYAGNVSIANHNLTHSSNGSYNNFSNIVELDGNEKEYVVQGSVDVPAISFELENPLNFANILTPLHNSVHDNDNSLTVTWTPEPTKNMTVMLTLMSEASDPLYTGIEDKVIADTGTYTFTASELQQFKTGILKILLRRGNYKFGYASNGKQYGAFAFSQNSIDIILND